MCTAGEHIAKGNRGLGTGTTRGSRRHVQQLPFIIEDYARLRQQA